MRDDRDLPGEAIGAGGQGGPGGSFVGDVVEIDVERIVPGGDGLGRLASGVVVLVSGGFPGDRVRAHVDEASARLVRARVVEVVRAGPHRRPDSAVCPKALDSSCGGCDWPAALPSSHEELKRSLVLDALRRIGGIDPSILPALRWHGSGPGYRLRSRLHVDAAGRLGFFAPRSTSVAAAAGTCELLSPALLSRIPRLAELLAAAAAGGESVAGDLQTLETPDGALVIGQLSASEKVRDPQALAASLKGSLDGVRIVGPGFRPASAGPVSLRLPAGGTSFTVSVSSFFQGNRFLLDTFLDEVRRMTGALARPGGAILDLYAGCGFLTRPLAETGLPTTAVESDPSSAADLDRNVAAWRSEGLKGVTSVRATVEGFLARRTGPWELVVADPPRAGLGPRVRKALLRAAPRHLLLVSCDPATLARDLKELRAAYSVADGALLDLFPGTHHVETLLLLRRRGPEEGRG